MIAFFRNPTAGVVWHPAGDGDDDTVQVAVDGDGTVFVRVSTDPTNYVELTVNQFAGFCDAVRAGEFRHVLPRPGESQE